MTTLPEADVFAALPLHVLARDFPEALAVCRRFGIDLGALGGGPVVAAAGPQLADLYAALRQATAWRASARPGPCERALARAATRPDLSGAAARGTAPVSGAAGEAARRGGGRS